MDIIKEYRMRKNTQHIDITTLTNVIEELNKNIVALTKAIKQVEKKKTK